VLTVVDERAHRRETERLLERRRGPAPCPSALTSVASTSMIT